MQKPITSLTVKSGIVGYSSLNGTVITFCPIIRKHHIRGSMENIRVRE